LGRDNQPLAGKRIVITRAPDQAQDIVRALESLGAEVFLFPAVSFAPPEDFSPLDRALRQLTQFDWILFTSQNAVHFFLARCRELDLPTGSLQTPRPLVAAVGPGTAQAATQAGVRVDYVAKNHTGETLAEELGGSIGGRKILVPHSDRSDGRLAAALEEAGAEVTAVVAYRTTAPEALHPEILSRLRRAEVDAVLFASPSAFHNLSASLGAGELRELSSRVHFAAIGPTTARALREEGVRVEIEAVESSAAGLADSLAKFFEHQPSGVRRP
jgi:uroporphyrinogen III methyltransferase/synthase